MHAMAWERLLLIAAGGALGALLRYGVGALVADRLGPTVLGTFIVNISGALVLGLFLGVTEGLVCMADVDIVMYRHSEPKI